VNSNLINFKVSALTFSQGQQLLQAFHADIATLLGSAAQLESVQRGGCSGSSSAQGSVFKKVCAKTVKEDI